MNTILKLKSKSVHKKYKSTKKLSQHKVKFSTSSNPKWNLSAVDKDTGLILKDRLKYSLSKLFEDPPLKSVKYYIFFLFATKIFKFT